MDKISGLASKLSKALVWWSSLGALLLGLLIFHVPISELLALSGSPDILPVLATTERGRRTGLPIPRFVSLASNRARMRVGPGLKYEIAWVYTKKALPMELLAEFDNWRKVRDHKGSVGWMHQSLLSGTRTALINPENNGVEPLRIAAAAGAPIVAWMEPGLLVSLSACDRTWCNVAVVEPRFSGYVTRKSLWGVYREPSVPLDRPSEDMPVATVDLSSVAPQSLGRRQP